MREIKFRAWLPNARRSVWTGGNPPDRRKRGRMIEFDELYFGISRDSLEHPQLFTDTPEHFYGEDLEASEKGAVLMQYTGLKDKNGVEIYQGDFLRHRHHPKDVAEVVWLPDGWHPQVKTPKGLRCYDFWQGTDLIETKLPYYEVIGNIYENPELLK